MSANKVLDLAERQGLLDAKVIEELRRQVTESKFIVTSEALAKVLVDHGHLTAFQARKLVATALGQPPPDPNYPYRAKFELPDELGLADDDSDHGLRQAAAAEDELILLEPVDPKPAPPAKPVFKPPKPGSAPVSSPLAPAAARPAGEESPRKIKREAPAVRPQAKATVEEIVDLDPVPPDPPFVTTKGPWKGPPASRSTGVEGLTPLAATDGLTPLGFGGATATSARLDDLFADPHGQASDPLAGGAVLGAPPVVPKGKGGKNVWDSPLLLIGGGVLGVIVVAFGLLYYSLTRGTAAEVLAQADEEYKSGSYTSAIAGYERFLKSYASDPNVSIARVRRGMAQLRQVTDDGKNPRQGLQTALTVLPQIETEEKFSEARLELSSILPDIADGFATQASQAQDTAQKEELVGLAGAALELVNNPSYLPASLRKDREPRIAAILEKLKIAQRGIEQDKELATVLSKIAAAASVGKAATAYGARDALLKVYPALEANPELIAAIREVTEKERQLVELSDEVVAALTDDPQAGTSRVALAVREGPMPAAEPGKIAFVGLEGVVYGMDVASGHVFWQRQIGYESLLPPRPVSSDPLADALVADARTHELLRLEAATGKVVWRQVIGQPFFSPVVADERIFVTTGAGQVLQIDAATGNVIRTAKLPQAASIATAFDSRQSRLIQLGEHSTLFVLDGETLAASETLYLGHPAGSILVPPVAVLDHVLTVESPADDHTLVRVFAPAGETKRLAEVGRGFRLKGRVVMPLVVAGRRIVAMTDLGQIAVWEVDPSNRKQPVRQVGGLEATEKTPVLGYYTADANRLWIANRRCSSFEIQAALSQLARKWSRHQDDVFIAPLQTHAGVLIHVRRRGGTPGVVVEGCQAASGETIWTTQLAAPVAALLHAPRRKAVDAVTQQGRVFPISHAGPTPTVVETPAFPLPQGSLGGIWPQIVTSPDGASVAWTETQTAGRVFTYRPGAGDEPAAASLPEEASAAAGPAVFWGANLLVPARNGQVELLEPTTGKQVALPFMPPLSPTQLPEWTSPAVLPDGSGFVIGDGRHTLYRVGLKPQPQPHLAAVAERVTETSLHGNLVALEDTLYGIGSSDAGDVVVALDPFQLTPLAQWPLQGKAQFGPVAVQGAVFVGSETDGLLCFEAGQKLRWQRPLEQGPLAGPPVKAGDGEYLLLFQSGFVVRIAGATGDALASTDLGLPLGPAAHVVDSQLYVSTSDGSLLVTPLPQ
ncbi:MAG: PQQ-binding-like beta-propeller repeat protein [Pirellulaceae bacterium]